MALTRAGSLTLIWLLSMTVRAEVERGDGAAIVRSRCVACHGRDLIAQQRLSRDGWDRELAKMIAWGARLDDPERDVVIQYLATHFGHARRSAAVALRADVADPAVAALRTKCSVCHGVDLIDAQRLDAAGWAREIDKMVNWGAAVSTSEKDVIVRYLAK